MKNARNIVAAIVLMSTLTFGTTFAHAGIIIAKSGEAERTCSSTGDGGGLIDEIGGRILEGIIIARTGIIIAKGGIIIAKDGEAPCESKPTTEGIIIA